MVVYIAYERCRISIGEKKKIIPATVKVPRATLSFASDFQNHLIFTVQKHRESSDPLLAMAISIAFSHLILHLQRISAFAFLLLFQPSVIIIIIIIIIIVSLRKSFVGHRPSQGPSTAFYPGQLDATFFDADLSHLASGFLVFLGFFCILWASRMLLPR